MKVRKSVSAFVLGLISSIFCLGWGFIFGLVGDVATKIVGSSELSIIQVLGWACFLGGIVGIVGASMCFKNAKRGGIFLTVATIMCGSLQVYMFINIISAGNISIPTLVLLCLLPLALLVAGDICAFVAKEVMVNAPYYQQTASALPTQKTLEEKLTELKDMFDKKLLTEKEYNDARKKVIDKHTNN